MTAQPALTVLSLGAGVQSTTLALLAVEGALPRPDVVVFADTGWEPATVYKHLDRLEAVLVGAGLPLRRVSAGNVRADALDPAHRFASVPYYTQRQPGPCRRCAAADARDEAEDGAEDGAGCVRCRGTGWDDGRGIARRQCTGEYKVKPIKAEIRRLLGYPHPARVPAGVYAVQWIGFSAEEVLRRNDHRGWPAYQRPAYPLMDELPMSRADCERWLAARGWTVVKSACVGCPFTSNRRWREMRDQQPAEWADAVAFDAAIRRGGARAVPLDGQAFLHPTRVPLSEAQIDRVSRREWADRQVDLLDVLAEQGDPDGCSPYGCRSGVPA